MLQTVELTTSGRSNINFTASQEDITDLIQIVRAAQNGNGIDSMHTIETWEYDDALNRDRTSPTDNTAIYTIAGNITFSVSDIKVIRTYRPFAIATEEEIHVQRSVVEERARNRSRRSPQQVQQIAYPLPAESGRPAPVSFWARAATEVGDSATTFGESQSVRGTYEAAVSSSAAIRDQSAGSSDGTRG